MYVHPAQFMHYLSLVAGLYASMVLKLAQVSLNG